MKQRVLGLTAVVSMLLGGGLAFAAAPVAAGDQHAPHIHQITTDAGTHDIAAGLCNAPTDAGGWVEGTSGNNFHHNVHVGLDGKAQGAPAASIGGSASSCD